MLKPTEYIAGALKDAQGLTLLLPRTQYEDSFLIIPDGNRLNAVTISGARLYHAFDCTTNEHWNGLLISNVVIETDETELFDPEVITTPLGSIVRKRDGLYIAVQQINDGTFHRPASIPIITGLPSCSDRNSVGFYSWQVVIGEGSEKRILKRFSVQKSASS